MSNQGNVWAVVLAAGDGSRLAALTTDRHGRHVPKQYCSLNGHMTLLQQAVERARRVVPPERIRVIVADQHRDFWRTALATLHADNVIVQPRNCGTAIGILLCVLTILRRDAQAHIVFLPADHHVTKEQVLAERLQAALDAGKRYPARLVVLGTTPTAADPALGYIIPGYPSPDGTHEVEEFIEKPGVARAQRLCAMGALWNTFIFTARGTALLAMLRDRLRTIVARMETAIADDAGHRELAELYTHLPSIDFSREIARGTESRMRLLAVSECGWSDLGTPERVTSTLRRLARQGVNQSERPQGVRSNDSVPAIVNLATRCMSLHSTSSGLTSLPPVPG
jgi:mannose-1-phosphate guanylyltransferase